MALVVVATLSACGSTGTKAADSAGCRAADGLFFEPAAGKDPTPTSNSTATIFAQMQSIRATTGSDAAARTQADTVLGILRHFDKDPTTLTEADGAKMEHAEDALITFAAKQCPPKVPTWACLARDDFHAVGEAINEDGTPVRDHAKDTTAAKALLPVAARRTGRVELTTTASRVTFGWKRADGLITETQIVTRTGSTWTSGDSSTCPKAT